MQGRKIDLSFRPGLSAWRGKLLSKSRLGNPVHAGSFIRERKMVLDEALLSRKNELRRVLLHEVFHFTWVRLSNQRRWDWEQVLASEAGARGELGWSSEWRRRLLTQADRSSRSRLWREYACESFCDSAAWKYGSLRKHDEHTLAARWRERRAVWFEHQFPGRIIPV